MSSTQAKWVDLVRRVLGKWFEATENGAGVDKNCSRWETVCGGAGSRLEDALMERDVAKVLEILYLLVKETLEKCPLDHSEIAQVGDFLEDLGKRLKVPRLELKHIWYAEGWHDYGYGDTAEFMRQDLDRANTCLAELKRGAYRPGSGFGWPWVIS